MKFFLSCYQFHQKFYSACWLKLIFTTLHFLLNTKLYHFFEFVVYNETSAAHIWIYSFMISKIHTLIYKIGEAWLCSKMLKAYCAKLANFIVIFFSSTNKLKSDTLKNSNLKYEIHFAQSQKIHRTFLFCEKSAKIWNLNILGTYRGWDNIHLSSKPRSDNISCKYKWRPFLMNLTNMYPTKFRKPLRKYFSSNFDWT